MNFLKNLKGISLIGIGDISSNGISAVFWFYLATLILPSEYGQIHYFISIAAIASTISLVGQQNAITVYISKNKTLVSTLFLTSLLCSIASLIILTVIFQKFDVGLLTMGMVLFTHGIATSLGNEDFKTYTIFSILQKILLVVFGLSFYYYFGVEAILIGTNGPFFLLP